MPFLEDGEPVELLAKFDGGFVVRREFEQETEEFANGEPFITTRVFDVVPTSKKEEQIRSLESDIARLKAEREKIRANSRDTLAELEKTRREIGEFRKMSAEDATLKRLYEMICGKITHVVVENEYRPEVLTAAEAQTQRWTNTLRMLTLDGSLSGELVWKISRDNYRRDEYPDVVTPCLSREEALTCVAPFVAKNLSRAGDIDDLEKAIARANKIGIEVPQAHIDRLAKMKSDAIADKRRKIEAELAQLNA